MLIDRTHKPWIFGSVLTLAVSASAYWAMSKQSIHGPSGGSVLGLILGIVGSLMMIFAALLAVRKRLPTWRVGSAQFWLRGHLWLGTLGFVLILFHAGFAWGGLLENLLWVSFGLVVVTGFAGVALQQVIPRLLTTRVPLETMVAQIPFLSRTMQFRADQLVARQAGVLDVDYESLKPFAEEVLKQQRVLKRESDFPKELAKVYANVLQPEAEAKKPAAHAPAEIVSTKAPPTSPLAPGEGGRSPGEGPVANAPSNATPAATETPPAAKPKSPLELMREKAAAKAAGDPPAAPNAVAASTPPATESPKKLSPIEQMRAKAAAKSAADAAVPSPPEVAAPAVEKKLSPIEQMRAKMAAKSATSPETAAPTTQDGTAAASTLPVEASAPTAEKKLSPIEQMRAKMAAKQAPSTSAAAPAVDQPPAAATPEKKLSPLEQMQAKLAAAKAASPDKPAETHKPLTIEKPATAESSAAEKPVPPVVKKPAPVAKPTAEKPVAASPKTPVKAAAPVPPALLAELRDFHIRVVRPFLNNGRSPQHRLDDNIAARRVFAQLRSDLPAELHESIQQLEDLCDERRQFNTQLRLHRWLHWWLILHIPPSIALLVLFVAHVIVSLRVVPFGR